MTSDEADQRMVLSRHTLANYAEMIEGQPWSFADFTLFEQELDALEAFSEHHPGKTKQIIGLVGDWVKLRCRLR